MLEKARDEERVAQRGEWIVPRTVEEETEHVSELMQLLRMRHIDVTSAMNRAKDLARRLWNSTLISMDESLSGLRKLGVIVALTKWYFEALARSLAPEPTDRMTAESLMVQGQKLKDESRRLQRQSESIRRQAMYEDSRPRKWRTEGLMTPEDRRLEVKFRENLQRTYSKADALKRRSDRLIDDSERYMTKAKDMLPKLPDKLRTFRYYYSRLNVARTRGRMQDEIGKKYFESTLRGAMLESQKGLTPKQLEGAIRRIVQSREAEQAASKKHEGTYAASGV